MASGKPRRRGQCAGGARPCPWVSCRHNLVLDRHHDWEVDDLPTCALDVAEDGGLSVEETAEILGTSREEILWLEREALRKIREKLGLPSPD